MDSSAGPEVEVNSIRAFFFRGMLAGWVGDGKYTASHDMLGFKRFWHREGDLVLLDEYSSVEGSNTSSGRTVIWNGKTPVWSMTYRGIYPESVIQFLKEVLRETYKRGMFCGGRGWQPHTGPDFVYINNVEASDFGNFFGKEVIHSASEKDGCPVLGYHRYEGGMLI